MPHKQYTLNINKGKSTLAYRLARRNPRINRTKYINVAIWLTYLPLYSLNDVEYNSPTIRATQKIPIVSMINNCKARPSSDKSPKRSITYIILARMSTFLNIGSYVLYSSYASYKDVMYSNNTSIIIIVIINLFFSPIF